MPITEVEYALIRKAMRDEASGIDGLESDGSSPSPVWRWPLRSVTDPAYLEDACAYCGETLGPRWLNTGNGPHHKDCWNERTTPGNREERR